MRKIYPTTHPAFAERQQREVLKAQAGLEERINNMSTRARQVGEIRMCVSRTAPWDTPIVVLSLKSLPSVLLQLGI
jgi:hypothetical protein